MITWAIINFLSIKDKISKVKQKLQNQKFPAVAIYGSFICMSARLSDETTLRYA